eukprot:351882-Chlamydomonas_euryale.AAC.15
MAWHAWLAAWHAWLAAWHAWLAAWHAWIAAWHARPLPAGAQSFWKGWRTVTYQLTRRCHL